jgi:hypothetical protein
MDEVSPGLVAQDPPSKTPLQRTLLGAGIFVVAVAVMVALEGGRPASMWFYPFVAILGIASAYRSYTNKNWGKLVAVPGESKRRSFEWALAEGVLVAIVMYCAYALLSTDEAIRRSSWWLSLLFVYFSYCRRRGEKPSNKILLLVIVAGFVWVVTFRELWRALR